LLQHSHHIHTVLMPPLKHVEKPTIQANSAFAHINRVKRIHRVKTASSKQAEELNGEVAETRVFRAVANPQRRVKQRFRPSFFEWNHNQSLCGEVDKRRCETARYVPQCSCNRVVITALALSFYFYRSQGAMMGPTIGAPYPI
jgi:hypothetical protein